MLDAAEGGRPGRKPRTQIFSRPSNELPKRRSAQRRLERRNMPEKHFTIAVSLAKILFNTREQFADALRDAAITRIEASPTRSIYAGRAAMARRALQPHVDDALYAIGRDGLEGLEVNVKIAIDAIVREALDAARKGTPCE